MKESNSMIPENIIIIKDEYYYCTNNLIYKGQKCEIYRGKEKSNNIIDSNNSYGSSLTICVKKEPPFLKYPELEKEHSILEYLQKFLEKDIKGNVPCPFIPKIYKFYPSLDSPSFLIEELLGSSVDTIFKMCQRKFTIMSTLIIIQQILHIIQKLHEKGIIHRNLNPTKFLFGKEETTDILMSKIIKSEININPESQLYLIDYAEAKFFVKDNNLDYNNNHIKFNDKIRDFSFTNKNFCSIWAELKMEQSRRDDLYSIFYIMIYLLSGKLPWIGIKGKNKEDKREKIRNLKLCLSNFELCQNVNKIIQNEVELFVFYLNGLSFEDEPNYNYLNQIVDDMMKKIFNSKNMEYICPTITIKN